MTSDSTDRARALIERWSTAATDAEVCGPLPIRFHVERDHRSVELAHHNLVVVTLTMLTLERDTNRQIEIKNRHEMFGEPDPELLRKAAQQMYVHEMDEWFRFRGERTFDPHRESAS